MGARFLGIALAASVAWYAWHWHSSPIRLGGVAWRVMLISFAAAVAGKIWGLAVFKMKAAGV